MPRLRAPIGGGDSHEGLNCADGASRYATH